MGVFQRYIKKDKNGNAVLDKKGKPKKEGPWFAQYPHERDPKTGKIKYRTEKVSFSKKKAEQFFRTKSDKFQEVEQFGVQPNTDMSFEELVNWGLDQEVMKIKASAADDRVRVVNLVKEFENHKAAQITPLMVDNFRIKMTKTISSSTGRPYSGTTINKMVSLARRIYYLGMDAGIVKSNPFARRGVFKEEAKGKYIPESDFRAILPFLPLYLQAFVTAAYMTGMRRGELIDLTCDRVNIAEGFIDLTPEDTKTEEHRRIYFNSIPELKNVITAAMNGHRNGNNYVFTKPDGSQVPKWYIQRLFKKACKKAGVPDYRIHDLRHSFNTNMLKAGVSQTVIMKLTGHKTNEMFLRYSHLDKEQGEAAMGKLDQFLTADD
ncbi:putative Integrase family protein [Desulfamplus magnetovallimortis]|uniref:Putative Integrase family protein n=1 Tax=Desulfamplus magnetovallimortis TaxID=1246637 RepID=A0A1W1HEA2_9BACT|nr:site-specific integrase [Desulfamplus magnetovallimortis]SLM30766.1 putative Integrase family protein [Desulfamplus magnetovallimortis]